METRALILADIQNDFCPGGALPVQEGHVVVPLVNRLQDRFGLVVATQDWHPPDHGSFASRHGRAPGEVIDLDGIRQILWPDHCVQESEGADFHIAFRLARVDAIFRKGTNPRIDGYSGFFDNGRRRSTGMAGCLRERGVKEVFVAGLATDYCVKFTALDAVSLGFRTTVIEDACRGIDLRKGDIDRALSEMKRAGVRIVRSGTLAAPARARR